MNWPEFIVQLSQAWAWPAVTGAGIALLRKQIRTAADRLVERIGEIAHLQFPGGSIDFKREARELAETTAAETEELAAATPDFSPAARSEDATLPPETADERLAKYRELAVLEPRAAILLAFTDIESTIRQRFRQLHPEERLGANFRNIVELLYDDGLLDDEIVDALRRMSKIRNEVAHEQTGLDLDVANYFVESAGNVFEYLLLAGFFGDNPTPQG